MKNLLDRIEMLGVIPVITLDAAADAEPLAEALCAGGLPCAEVTFRTDAAAETIRRMLAAFPEMLVAAGTVLNTETADEAMEAGAAFLVSPGFNPAVVRHCLDRGYPVIPGVCTPTEVEMAMAFGLRYLKFFPAEAAGGVGMIRAMMAPYRSVRFLPTGGINLSNLGEYLSCKAVFACGGSWVASSGDISTRNFEKIKQSARRTAALVKEIRA